MGKAGVPPAVVCECPLKQAGRLLYPLFRSLLRNMSYLIGENLCASSEVGYTGQILSPNYLFSITIHHSFCLDMYGVPLNRKWNIFR